MSICEVLTFGKGGKEEADEDEEDVMISILSSNERRYYVLMRQQLKVLKQRKQLRKQEKPSKEAAAVAPPPPVLPLNESMQIVKEEEDKELIELEYESDPEIDAQVQKDVNMITTAQVSTPNSVVVSIGPRVGGGDEKHVLRLSSSSSSSSDDDSAKFATDNAKQQDIDDDIKVDDEERKEQEQEQDKHHHKWQSKSKNTNCNNNTSGGGGGGSSIDVTLVHNPKSVMRRIMGKFVKQNYAKQSTQLSSSSDNRVQNQNSTTTTTTSVTSSTTHKSQDKVINDNNDDDGEEDGSEPIAWINNVHNQAILRMIETHKVSAMDNPKMALNYSRSQQKDASLSVMTNAAVAAATDIVLSSDNPPPPPKQFPTLDQIEAAMSSSSSKLLFYEHEREQQQRLEKLWTGFSQHDIKFQMQELVKKAANRRNTGIHFACCTIQKLVHSACPADGFKAMVPSLGINNVHNHPTLASLATFPISSSAASVARDTLESSSSTDGTAAVRWRKTWSKEETQTCVFSIENKHQITSAFASGAVHSASLRSSNHADPVTAATTATATTQNSMFTTAATAAPMAAVCNRPVSERAMWPFKYEHTIAHPFFCQCKDTCDCGTALIVDEAHHIAATTYRLILSTLPSSAAPYFLGVSAEINRRDGKKNLNELLLGKKLMHVTPQQQKKTLACLQTHNVSWDAQSCDDSYNNVRQGHPRGYKYQRYEEFLQLWKCSELVAADSQQHNNKKNEDDDNDDNNNGSSGDSDNEDSNDAAATANAHHRRHQQQAKTTTVKNNNNASSSMNTTTTSSSSSNRIGTFVVAPHQTKRRFIQLKSANSIARLQYICQEMVFGQMSLSKKHKCCLVFALSINHVATIVAMLTAMKICFMERIYCHVLHEIMNESTASTSSHHRQQHDHALHSSSSTKGKRQVTTTTTTTTTSHSKRDFEHVEYVCKKKHADLFKQTLFQLEIQIGRCNYARVLPADVANVQCTYNRMVNRKVFFRKGTSIVIEKYQKWFESRRALLQKQQKQQQQFSSEEQCNSEHVNATTATTTLQDDKFADSIEYIAIGGGGGSDSTNINVDELNDTAKVASTSQLSQQRQAFTYNDSLIAIANSLDSECAQGELRGHVMQIIVASVQNSGEGKDIKGLDCIVFADEPQSVIQNCGRLRDHDKGTIALIDDENVNNHIPEIVQAINTLLFTTVKSHEKFSLGSHILNTQTTLNAFHKHVFAKPTNQGMIGIDKEWADVFHAIFNE